MTGAPGWLVAEVAEGLQRLLVLRLEGTPPADAIDGVVLAWCDALLVSGVNWDDALDAPRIRQAFRLLAAHATRWPAPVQLRDHLPARPERMKLPPPPMTAEQKQRARAMLADIVRKMGVKP
jgi:hypothetical protein